MSTAAAEAEQPSPPKSKKKLFIILALALVLLGGAAVGGLLYMQHQARLKAEAEEESEDAGTKAAGAEKSGKRDAKSAPPFLAIEPFTVNLADRDASRYAQITISLELEEAKAADLVKAYLPAIRSNVLLLLSAKTSAQLIEPQGKVELAREIHREVLRPLGIEVEEPEEEARSAKEGKRRKPRAAPVYPVRAVHFSNFIVQ